MKTGIRLTTTGLLILLCVSTLSLPVSAREDIGSKLPPDVRVLLIQEMAAILSATQTIIDAMVRGEDRVVAQEAQDIHDSFGLPRKKWRDF